MPLWTLFWHFEMCFFKEELSRCSLIRSWIKRLQKRQSQSIKTIFLTTSSVLTGYPEQTKHPQNGQKDPPPLNTEWSYLKMSYISERLNYRITKALFEKRAYQYVSRTSHTLKRTSSQNNTERTCASSRAAERYTENNRELKHARVWNADGNRKWAVFTFNFPAHNHIHIANYLFTIRNE